MKFLAGGFLLLVAALLNQGCQPRDSRSGTEYLGNFHPANNGRANFDDVSYWDGEGVGGAPSVRISLGEQRAYFYKAGQLVGVSTISTGREGHNTPTGSYKIQQKDIDHKSSIYGDYTDKAGNPIRKDIERGKDPMPSGAVFDGAKMPYFMRITGGVGMHQGFLPGYPASHGCIRMPGFMAQNFFQNVQVGTPVTVSP